MNDKFASLFDHEKDALLASLRRDARSELLKAQANKTFAAFHMTNYYAVVRILECLNPKHLRPNGMSRIGIGSAQTLAHIEEQS